MDGLAGERVGDPDLVNFSTMTPSDHNTSLNLENTPLDTRKGRRPLANEGKFKMI